MNAALVFIVAGFPMTRIITGRLREQDFSFLQFDAARFDRIGPALFGLCLAQLTVGLVFIDPLVPKQLGRHITGSPGCVSNIQYHQEAGYLDRKSDGKGLRHTWSLSVEWQFDLTDPVCLALA